MRLHNPRSGGLEDPNDGKWKISPIDWEPLKQTMRNGGPDSARRISDARNAWNNAAWVRDALTNRQSLPTPMTITQEALDEVRTAVAAVRDPEYPDLNIEQLGILEDVVADAAGIRVDLIPTILGCPALATIERDVLKAARAAGYEVIVQFCSSPVWTPDRISDDARRFLANEYTIAISTLVSVPLPVRYAEKPHYKTEVRWGLPYGESVKWCPDCRNPIEVVRSRQGANA